MTEFAINPNSGILTSNRVFDYEERYLYNVSVSATDIVGHQVISELLTLPFSPNLMYSWVSSLEQ